MAFPLGPRPGVGNVRFERYMPRDVDALERAEREGWSVARLAAALEIEEERVPRYQEMYREAKDIVDAPTLAESFRRGVRYAIEHALEEGLQGDEEIAKLVTQICYRAADLGYRLEVEGESLSALSPELCYGSESDPDIG